MGRKRAIETTAPCSQSVLCCFCGLFLDSDAELECHVKSKHRPSMSSLQTPQTSSEIAMHAMPKATYPNFIPKINEEQRFLCRDCGLFFPEIGEHLQHYAKYHLPNYCMPAEKVEKMETCSPPLSIIKEEPAQSSTINYQGTDDVALDLTGDSSKIIDKLLTADANKCRCARCGFQCVNSEELAVHVAAHSLSKLRYMCPKCQKRFPRRIKLEDHYRIHTGEKPYKCPMCPAAFCQLSNRNRHINTHRTNFRPYVCHICDCGFSRRFSLISHYHVHGDAHPFRCNKCGQCFALISELQEHVAEVICSSK